MAEQYPSSPFAAAVQAIESGNKRILHGILRPYKNLVFETEYSGQSEYTLLHHAASSHTLRHDAPDEIVKILLEAGAPVDAVLPGGATPLHFAASLNHIAVVRTLLDAGAPVEAEDGGKGGTPLIHALFYGCTEAADILASVKVVPDNLRVAAGLGRTDRIQEFFDGHGNLLPEARRDRAFYRPHSEFPEWSPSNTSQEILDEALVYACINDRLNVLDCLLAHGACVSGKPYFATGLHYAAWNGYGDVVAFLMDHGADGTLCDDQYGGQPWGWAQYGGHDDLKKYILDRTSHTDLLAAVALSHTDRVLAHLNARTASTDQLTGALAKALEDRNNTLVDILISHGARPSFSSAARYGLADEVIRYIDEGASPGSVLADAAAGKQPDICRMLINAGASPTVFEAAALNLVEEVDRVLRGGIDINIPDLSGYTPLHHAVRSHAVESTKLLLICGASISHSYDGYTYGGAALHIAAATDADENIIDLLLEYGADINQSSNEGTPLDAAIRTRSTAAARILQARGAKTGRQLGDWPHRRSG